MARSRRTRQETEDLLLAEYERKLPAGTALQRTFRSCALPKYGTDFHSPAYLKLRPRHLRSHVLADWLSQQPLCPKWLRRFGFYKFACGILSPRPTEFTRIVLVLQYGYTHRTVYQYLKAARARRRASAAPRPAPGGLPG